MHARRLLEVVNVSVHVYNTEQKSRHLLKRLKYSPRENQMSNSHAYCVAIKPISFFRSSEDVDESDVKRLAAIISDADVWTTPIPIDIDTGIIMDGNHRASAAALLRLSHVPCVLLSYRDPRVRVMHWQTGEPFCVDRIYRSILTDRQIFPYKTTRHLFAPALPNTEIQLAVLR